MNEPLLKLKEAAELLKVAPVTVRLWTEKGMLKAERTPGGHRRYQLSDVKSFALKHGVTLSSQTTTNRVLIVDDDENWLTLLTSMLSNRDPELEIVTATSGFAAGKKVSAFKPDFVLLDLRMPGMSGLDVCKDIKSTPELADTKIFIITGLASDEEQNLAMAAGAEACLQKPIDFDELFILMGL